MHAGSLIGWLESLDYDYWLDLLNDWRHPGIIELTSAPSQPESPKVSLVTPGKWLRESGPLSVGQIRVVSTIRRPAAGQFGCQRKRHRRRRFSAHCPFRYHSCRDE